MMNRLQREIADCMRGLKTETGGEFSARFVFPKQFAGFKGHFPGNPVLPGICQIQAVLVMLQALRRCRLRLGEVLTAKFLAPVICEQELVFYCRQEVSGDDIMVNATVLRGGQRTAEMVLRINGDGGTGKK